MKEESLRQRRVSRLLRDALGPILAEELGLESSGLVSVTRVEVPADLRLARVYLSFFGLPDPSSALAFLESRTGMIRRRLASTVELKYNPQLFFRLDPSAADVERIDRLLDASRKNDRNRD